MGGAVPRAAVRASSRRDSRAAGEREGVGVRARLPAGSVTREGAARALGGAARSRGAMPARRAAWLTVARRDAAHFNGKAVSQARSYQAATEQRLAPPLSNEASSVSDQTPRSDHSALGSDSKSRS